MVAQTGNMYNGLWYPIIIAAVTFVVGMLFVRETKDRHGRREARCRGDAPAAAPAPRRR